jgi:low molecular weight protein-tyrosine phosphatase
VTSGESSTTIDMPREFTVCFVCTGNRARSPLAEAMLRSRIDPREISVCSCGTLDLGGRPALPDAITVGSSHGVDLTRHRARQMAPGSLCDTDLVIGFEPSHVDHATAIGGARPSRTFLALELFELLDDAARDLGADALAHARSVVEAMGARRRQLGSRAGSVRDPYGEPHRAFVETARIIDAATALLAAALTRRP